MRCYKAARLRHTECACYDALSLITQRLDHRQHLFKRNESAAVLYLVSVDCARKLAGIRREFVITVRKLSALEQRLLSRLQRATPIEERLRFDKCAGRHSMKLL